MFDPKTKLGILSLVVVTFASPAQAGLVGISVTATNTFQSDSQGVPETNVGNFGFANDLVAIIDNGSIEFPSFITIYDVDFSDDSLQFTWTSTDPNFTGVTPGGNFDRNYFTFDFQGTQELASVELDLSRSDLLPGSALPTVQIIAPNQFVTVFGAGVNRNLGFNPVFSVTTSAVPEPTSLALLASASLSLLGFRRRS